MPYSMEKVPKLVQNWPKGMQRIFIDVFNATLTSSKDEDKARIAGIAAAKNKYEKFGNRWVRREVKKNFITTLGTPKSNDSLNEQLNKLNKLF